MDDTPLRPTMADSIPLMKQLARMANADWCKFRRMVLVLDVNAAPTLFTESFLQTSEEQLVETPLVAEEKAVHVDTTSMQNQKFRTGVDLDPKRRG